VKLLLSFINKEYPVLLIYLGWILISRAWFRQIWDGSPEYLYSQAYQFVQFFIGAHIGWLLPALDHLIYCFTYPHELTPKRVTELLKMGKYKESINLIYTTTNERTKLTLRSVLFQSVFIVFGFWMTTSSGSEFGTGLVLSAMLRFLLIDWKAYKSGNMESVFWQIKRPVGRNEAKIAFVIFSAIFIYLSLIIF
jgi:hypothetical protein